MDSTSLVPSDDVTDVVEQPSQALVKTSMRALDGQYRPPKPGRSLRTGMRTLVLLGGSVAIGTGVAMGAFGVLPAAMMAVGLATAQVVAQSMYQNRLGQNVMGGIARGDLDQALHAAEKALEESPTGAMRTLAASNLASVLMQADRVHDGARVLDRYPPGRIGSIPLSTVLWLNNRAFAHVVLQRRWPALVRWNGSPTVNPKRPFATSKNRNSSMILCEPPFARLNSNSAVQKHLDDWADTTKRY